MTPLVLELIPSGSTERLLSSLIGTWPKFYTYAMSFLVLGISGASTAPSSAISTARTRSWC